MSYNIRHHNSMTKYKRRSELHYFNVVADLIYSKFTKDILSKRFDWI